MQTQPDSFPQQQDINLLIAQFSNGQYRQAAILAKTLTERFPRHGFAWKLLGMIFQKQGQTSNALSVMQHSIMLAPDDAHTYLCLGNLYQEMQHFNEAETVFRHALLLQIDYVDAYINLGNLLQETHRFREAELAFLRALQIDPKFAEGHNNLACLLHQSKRLGEAEAIFLHALELKPDYIVTLNNLGNLYKEMNRLAEAEAAYRRALQLKPDFSEAYNNLGHLLKEMKRLPEAEAAYFTVLKARPNSAEIHNDLGKLFKEMKRFPEAEVAYRRALELKSNFAEAKWNFSLLLLTLGRYAEAWPYYESRYDPQRKESKTKLPEFPFPQWHGEPLSGKSLVICPEQGFGDAIQFIRYVPLLKEAGVIRLTLVCASPLKALLETIAGISDVLTDITRASKHDYWTFPLSLPLYFGTTTANIPTSLPYLSALPERINYWHERIPQQGFKVGLVWKGRASHRNDTNRSLPGLTTLAPLWSVPGINFISLQKGQGEDEAKQAPANQPLVNLGADIQDFADTAAIVDDLDLVICVDTAIAHLAGALAKPCWVLLPAFGTDWRWLEKGNSSPWYPRVMQIFRQTQPDNWDLPIASILVKLKYLLTHPRPASIH